MSVPTKPSLATYSKVPSGSCVTVPLRGSSTALMVRRSSSGSVSLIRASMMTGATPTVAALSSVAVGAVLTGSPPPKSMEARISASENPFRSILSWKSSASNPCISFRVSPPLIKRTSRSSSVNPSVDRSIMSPGCQSSSTSVVVVVDVPSVKTKRSRPSVPFSTSNEVVAKIVLTLLGSETVKVTVAVLVMPSGSTIV